MAALTSVILEAKRAETIYVVRHGDRLDFELGEEKWEEMSLLESRRDPPLSLLGEIMAHETGRAIEADIAKRRCDQTKPSSTQVISSPFLRCIQTSNPIAGRLSGDVKIKLDNSLFEVVYTDEKLPTSLERARYFPRIDTSYNSIFTPQISEQYPNAGKKERVRGGFFSSVCINPS